MRPNKGFSQLIVLLLLLGVVLVTTYIVFQKTTFFNKAAERTIARNVSGDLWADTVLGQPDFSQGIPGEVTAYSGANPAGVTIDRSKKPNRVYIFDGINSRVLGYKSLGVCSNNPLTACSSKSDCGGNSCTLQVAGAQGKKKADIVIGQPTFNFSACNGDGTWQSKPDFPKPTASTLCSTLPSEPSAAEAHPGASMDTDANGKLFLADFYNNRVLAYNDPFQSTVANEVWGQADFTSYLCNGGGTVNNSSFCFINNSPSKPEVGGLDIDPQGNLWVVDSGNNRVLRFPKDSTGTIAKAANLVLGQANFQSNSPGSSLTQLHAPSSVRVDSNGKVYVADSENNRIVVYDSPSQNGASARIFNANARKVTGLDIDSSGNIWANETSNHQLVQYNSSGVPQKVLFKAIYDQSGNCGSGAVCNSPLGHDTCNMCDSKGSVGITTDGDVLVASANFSQTVNYYPSPIPAPTPGNAYPATAQFFSPPFGARNLVTPKSLQSPRGIAVAGNQIIVADMERLLFYNNTPPVNILSWAPASGIVNASSWDDRVSPHYGRISASDKSLWVLRENELTRYTLPLSPFQRPAQTIELNNLQILGSNSPIGNNSLAAGIYAEADDKYVWLAFPYQYRVARIRVPLNFNGTYIVDALIGGNTIPAQDRTWHRSCPDLKTLCAPGAVTQDREGNIFVSDYYIENEGTGRLIRFDKSQFPKNNTQLITLLVPEAKQVFDSVKGWEPAFDSDNTMYLGLAAFTPGQGLLRKYNNVINQKGPTLTSSQTLNDHYAQAFSLTFDDKNNLFVTDMNHGRVLIYKNPSNILQQLLPPQVNFTYTAILDPKTGIANRFSFKNTTQSRSKLSLTNKWVFGDGSTSSSADAQHTYKAPAPGQVANYTVTLTVSDGKNLPVSVSKVISIPNPRR